MEVVGGVWRALATRHHSSAMEECSLTATIGFITELASDLDNFWAGVL